MANIDSIKLPDNTTYDLKDSVSNYIAKSNTAGLVKNDGSIDTTQYISQHQDISGKADKVSSPTNGDLAALNASGNLTDSGKKVTDFGTSGEISAIVNRYGSKNLLKLTPETSGIFTVNSDGTVDITGNTGSSSVTFNLVVAKHLPSGSLTLTGFTSMQTDCFLYVIDATTSTSIGGDAGAGFTFTPDDSHLYTILISVFDNAQVSGTKIYPMLRDARITDATFVPYCMTNAELTEALADNNPGTHLRLTDLGTSYTAELKQDISSGKFEKVKVGGYLTINSHVYYIAHLDYWLHTGDTECTTHHAVVVPASSSLISGKMNNGKVVTGAYAGSDFKTGANSNTALADIKAIIQADFGSANILTHRELFTNAVDGNSASSGWAWVDSDIDLMNETMVYGHCVCSKLETYGHLYEVGIDKSQLELFAKRPDLITTRGYWWLRDVVYSTGFASVYDDGVAYFAYASDSFGIRPAFAIC